MPGEFPKSELLPELPGIPASGRKHADSKQRILKAACQVFAQRGFHGTHIRDLCSLAGVNIANICYYFRDKQGLYEAVAGAAREQLAHNSKCDAIILRTMPPEKRLQVVIESLFERLSGDSRWVVQLAARELVDPIKTVETTVATGFRTDVLLLETVILDLLGAKADPSQIHLTALSVLGQCIIYCAGSSVIPCILPEIDKTMFNAQNLMQHVQHLALCAVGHGGNKNEGTDYQL